MPLVDFYECDGPDCEEASKDYVKDCWIAVPCISWYDGYKEYYGESDPEPKYKKVIIFDEGRGSKLFCGWDCFEGHMKDC